MRISAVVTIDENYVQHLGVMLNSLMKHSSADLDVYVLYDGLSDSSMQKLRELALLYEKLTLIFKTVPDSRFENLHLCYHFTKVCYFRFVLSTVLPESLKKVIYLDPDMVVLEDLATLWAEELSDSWVAGVEVQFDRHESIGLPDDAPYFCSGVMIFNLDAWREYDLSSDCFLRANELGDALLAVDQDVLNIVCQKHWRKLPARWNKTNDFFVHPYELPYERDEVRSAQECNGILHYTGTCKPWHYACVHPERKLYWDYIKGTPWEHSVLEQKNIRTFFIRLVSFRLKNILIKWVNWIKKKAG